MTVSHTLIFQAERSHSAEFTVELEPQGVISLVASYRPERDRDISAHATAEEAADAIEDRVQEHFPPHDPLRRIVCLHDPQIVGVRLLGRYAVPIIHRDTGERPEPQERR